MDVDEAILTSLDQASQLEGKIGRAKQSNITCDIQSTSAKRWLQNAVVINVGSDAPLRVHQTALDVKYVD